MFKRLKNKMRDKAISQKQLAAHLGICEKSMSFKMNGVREFTRREMLQMCRLLDCTLDELFEEKG